MVDYFAVLGVPRQPWLDLDVLRERFLALSKELHPDKAPTSEDRQSGDAYASLNMAYQCLRHPRERLAHLIQIETGARPKSVDEVPGELTDFYMKLTQLLREAGAFNGRWSPASPMMKTQLIGEARELIEKLQQAQGEINSRSAEMDAELANLSSQSEGHAERLERIGALHRKYSYYTRLSEQTQELLTRLFI